jgi:hypothetical protein
MRQDALKKQHALGLARPVISSIEALSNIWERLYFKPSNSVFY